MHTGNRLLVAAALLCILLANNVFSEEHNEHEQLRSFLEQNISAASSFEDRFDAEVWLVDMSRRLEIFIKDPQQRLNLLRQVHGYAQLSQLPPELVLAVIEVESHFDRYAISRVGAQGLMQVMPFWKKEIGRPDDNLVLTETNLSYGCRILQFYLQQEQGRLSTALARYNGSAGSRVYVDKVEKAWRERWRLEALDWH
jgi:soluble lytic murein transglycosylase-like protein